MGHVLAACASEVGAPSGDGIRFLPSYQEEVKSRATIYRLDGQMAPLCRYIDAGTSAAAKMIPPMSATAQRTVKKTMIRLMVRRLV